MVDSLVPVAVACRCPGTPHSDGDVVSLSPQISLAGGMLAEAVILRVWSNLDERGEATMKALAVESSLREVYLLDGVKAWTFVDDEGEPLEVDEQAIRDRLLSNFTLARPVGDKADELYTASVMDPLRARLRKFLRSSQRRASTSTSPSSPSSAKRPRPLKPSSTSTTAKVPRSA